MGDGTSKTSVDIVMMDKAAVPTPRGFVKHVLSRATERPADFGQVVEAEVGRERGGVAIHCASDIIIILVCKRIFSVLVLHLTPIGIYSGQDGLKFCAKTASNFVMASVPVV